jgi:hypothetical protein
MSRTSRRIAARIAKLEKQASAVAEGGEREPTFYDQYDYDENGYQLVSNPFLGCQDITATRCQRHICFFLCG